MEGVCTKVQHGKGGQRGGVSFSRGALYWLLSNPIYIGKLRHKDKLHDGLHGGIVPDELWEAVQAKLKDSAVERGDRTTGSGSALLLGMIRDADGRPMPPSFSVKGGRRYHYYVSSLSKDIDRGLVGETAVPIARVAAGRLEVAVREALHALLTDERQLVDLLGEGDTATTHRRLATAAELARLLGPYATDAMRSLFKRLDVSLTVYGDRVDASIARAALLAALDHNATIATEDDRRIALIVNTNITQRKRGTRLIIAGNAYVAKEPDPSLVALIAKAHQARTALFSQAAPRGNRHIERLARLAYLAPDITTAILEGTQPTRLTSRKLLKLPALPLGWPEQRKLLGFA